MGSYIKRTWLYSMHWNVRTLSVSWYSLGAMEMERSSYFLGPLFNW